MAVKPNGVRSIEEVVTTTTIINPTIVSSDRLGKLDELSVFEGPAGKLGDQGQPESDVGFSMLGRLAVSFQRERKVCKS